MLAPIPQVVQAKTEERDGYTALQVGVGAKRAKQVSGTERGHFTAAGVPILRALAEFRVTPDALLPPGTELRADLFVPGQYVDVSGTSIGKGFAGVMKRWGFAGGPASHGTSLAHRVPGSTGGNQDPGKVWKGKKLSGRLGGVRKTVQNCLVYKVSDGGLRDGVSKGPHVCPGSPPCDRVGVGPSSHGIPCQVPSSSIPWRSPLRSPLLTRVPGPTLEQVDAARNLIHVVGQVPGHKGNFVRVSDAVKKGFEQQPARPLMPPAVQPGAGAATLDPNGRDPYETQD